MRAYASLALLAALVGAAGVAASFRPGNAVGPSCSRVGACTDCHEGSVTRTHTAEFVRSGHGAPARAGRATCLSCHKSDESCDACHEKYPPDWHTEAFRNPSRGPDERRAHCQEAALRRDSCLECHENRFLESCSRCHLREEWRR